MLILPKPIATYVGAENDDDMTKLAECFAHDAVVRDEGRTFEGLAAIEEWKTQAKKKYQHTVEPLAYVPTQVGGVLTMRLTGNFPGSPIDVKFDFALKDDMITSLAIHS
jgi:hypothetical protein